MAFLKVFTSSLSYTACSSVYMLGISVISAGDLVVQYFKHTWSIICKFDFLLFVLFCAQWLVRLYKFCTHVNVAICTCTFR